MPQVHRDANDGVGQAPGHDDDPRLADARRQTGDAQTTWRAVLAGGSGAPGLARREIAAHLDGELGSERSKDMVLLTGELVTNSVLHADPESAPDIVLELIIGPDAVRVVVTDGGSATVPTIQPMDAKRPGGRGLFLVESMSDRWGMTRDGPRATQVWFEMLRRRAAPSAEGRLH